MILVGTAGWSIPREHAHLFPEHGTALERYAARFRAVEINSSFHRPHRLSTWQRWADSVPYDFRFSVKLPKEVTHRRKLVDCSDELTAFLDQVGALGSKLAVLLVQVPPKLAFDRDLAKSFFAPFGERSAAMIACEPRHPSWFTDEADGLLADLGIARVAADPAICEGASRPGEWGRLRYWRLHGSPVIYRSSYGGRLDEYASALDRAAATGNEAWCVFDNTASSAAMGDALALSGKLEARDRPPLQNGLAPQATPS